MDILRACANILYQAPFQSVPDPFSWHCREATATLEYNKILQHPSLACYTLYPVAIMPFQHVGELHHVYVC